MRLQIRRSVLSASGLALTLALLTPAFAQPHKIMWVNHFDLLPGDASVLTSFNAVSSEVGGGLTALVVESSTIGEEAAGGGNKVVHMALDLPNRTRVRGVRVCYELSSASSFISQVRLAQIQDPPDSAVVLLDDGADLVDPGPLCVDSQPTNILSNDGSVLLSLRVHFGDTEDRIAIRAVGLLLQ